MKYGHLGAWKINGPNFVKSSVPGAELTFWLSKSLNSALSAEVHYQRGKDSLPPELVFRIGGNTYFLSRENSGGFDSAVTNVQARWV
jgi:hypothetical protein